tara:strand:+ start:127 stop:444 length:318 start_codon:yes stop_codon:yes gene_type:complete
VPISKSNIDPKFLISLAVGLAIQAAGIVWWASSLHSSVQHNDFQIQMMERTVTKNAEFVELWPAGKWGSGSLPDDVKQNLKIAELEKQMDKVMSKLYNGHSSPAP